MSAFDDLKAKLKAAPESVKLLLAAGVGFLIGAVLL